MRGLSTAPNQPHPRHLLLRYPPTLPGDHPQTDHQRAELQHEDTDTQGQRSCYTS